MKSRIRLTESDLYRIIKESVNQVLREDYHQNGMLIAGKITPQEFQAATQKGRLVVNGEANGYLVIKLDGRWYYLDKNTGELCNPDVTR